jgi:diguanylate cyclase (GGDEF)-like protein
MDIKTLLVIGIAIGFAASMAMFVVWRTRKTYPGFGWWTAGMACQVLGTLAFVLRAREPSWVSTLLPSGLLVINLILISRGMLVFRGRQIGYWLEAVLLLSYVGLFGFASFLHQDANVRIAVYSLYLGIGSLLTVYWILNRRPPYFSASELVLATSLVLQGVAAVARGVYSVTVQPEVVNHMLNSHLQGYFLLIQVVTAMLLPLVLINMNALRSEFDEHATQGKLRASLAQSERHREQMRALNAMNEQLMACRHLDDARSIIASSLQALFGAGRARYAEPGAVVLELDASMPSDEASSLQALAATANESIKLALSHLELEEALRTQALRDALTGLSNRRYLDEVLPRELERCRRQGEKLTLAMLDLDHFKRVNDNYGHDAGDAVLRTLGGLLRQWARSSDIVCRYGGEEFTLILQGSTPDDVSQRLQDLLQRVAHMEVQFDGRTLPPITVSIGVAQATAGVPDAGELLSRSDAGLYQAKQQGRNRVAMAAV